MCVMSAVSVAGSQIPLSTWTRPAFDEYKEILRRIEALDTKLGQPDCVDPAKEAWMKQVEERLSQLEARI